MSSDEVFDLLEDIHETERSFFSLIRFLDGQARPRILSMFLQNMATELAIVRDAVRSERLTTRVVLNMDMSGNFFDPVPVAPTAEQIAAGTEANVEMVADSVCSICQENLPTATRIRGCNHCFHDACIRQWLTMNPRCPMCRHDIREGGAGSVPPDRTFDNLLRALNEHIPNESSRVHPHPE
jgi:hypothetical protein